VDNKRCHVLRLAYAGFKAYSGLIPLSCLF
jgi:hypothetical protein